MCRWPSERRPPPVTSAVARLGIAALLLVPPSLATVQPVPESVPDASFSAGSVSFSDGSVSFGDGSVSFSDGSVSFSEQEVAAPAQESGRELRFELTADLLFDFDKAELRPEAEALLRDVLAQIKAKVKRPTIRVEGHTDAKGTDEYNDALSQRRAPSVKTWLVAAGRVPAKSVTIVGLGERSPVAPNEKADGTDDPAGRQKNRRVEIVVTSR
jgi:outer membrane protein OmpA-like peptidoglycan-associated protein